MDPSWSNLSWAVNLHKFLTVFVIALFMILFDNYSTVAWVYLALHGAYGFCWLLKHVAFRRRQLGDQSNIWRSGFPLLVTGDILGRALSANLQCAGGGSSRAIELAACILHLSFRIGTNHHDRIGLPEEHYP